MSFAEWQDKVTDFTITDVRQLQEKFGEKNPDVSVLTPR